MVAFGVAIVVASGYVLAFWSQRVAGDRKAELARANSLLGIHRRDGKVFEAKIAAQLSTIIALEHLVFNSGADSRELVRVMAEHRRMLADAAAAGLPDGHVSAKPGAARASSDAPVPSREGVLGDRRGDDSGGLHDPRGLVHARGRGVPRGE